MAPAVVKRRLARYEAERVRRAGPVRAPAKAKPITPAPVPTPVSTPPVDDAELDRLTAPSAPKPPGKK